MKFADPYTVTCPACASKSGYRPDDLLGLRCACAACGVSLAVVGERMRVMVEDHVAFYSWAEVLCVAEERLGVVTSGGEVLRGRQRYTGLTLGEIVGLLEVQLPAGVRTGGQAEDAVLGAASEVARHPVASARLGDPILLALGITLWPSQDAAPRAAADRGLDSE